MSEYSSFLNTHLIKGHRGNNIRTKTKMKKAMMEAPNKILINLMVKKESFKKI